MIVGRQDGGNELNITPWLKSLMSEAVHKKYFYFLFLNATTKYDIFIPLVPLRFFWLIFLDRGLPLGLPVLAVLACSRYIKNVTNVPNSIRNIFDMHLLFCNSRLSSRDLRCIRSAGTVLYLKSTTNTPVCRLLLPFWQIPSL